MGAVCRAELDWTTVSCAKMSGRGSERGHVPFIGSFPSPSLSLPKA